MFTSKDVAGSVSSSLTVPWMNDEHDGHQHEPEWEI